MDGTAQGGGYRQGGAAVGSASRRARRAMRARAGLLWLVRPFAHLLQVAQRGCRPTFRRMLVLSVLLPALGLAMAAWWEWVGVTQDERADVARALVTLDAQTLRTLEMQEVVLTAVAASTAELSWESIRSHPAIHDLLVRLSTASPAVETVGLVAPGGRLAAGSKVALPPPDVDLADRDYVAAFPAGRPYTAGDASYLGAPVIGRVDGQPQIHISRPRLVNGVADGGVLVAGFRPAFLERQFAATATTSTTDITLRRVDGTVLARYERAASGDGDAVDTRSVGSYPLVVVLRRNASLLLPDWLSRMAFPTFGALASAGLLLTLTVRARQVLEVERDRLQLRMAVAEAERRSAQQRAELEARLRQTEKTAALGQLAAGVAHDFNNLLQTVMIGAEALQRPNRRLAEVESLTALILKATDRGLALTARMLSFARRDDVAAPEPGPCGQTCCSPSQALRNVMELLDRTLGTQYRLIMRTPPQPLPPTRGGGAELETMLINLIVNARDAMPRGGDILIEATLATPPDTLRAGPGARYLRLVVADTGSGMDEATLARAGEAFFTTKPRGEGTGLGLSMARGFAKHAGGMLELHSVTGEGTRVTVWLAPA